MIRRSAFLFTLAALFLPFMAFAQGVFVSGDKQVRAGEVMNFSVSGLLTHESLDLTLHRPDGTTIVFDTLADEWGRVFDEVHSLHTRKAGLYKLVAQRDFASERPFQHSFVVSPGDFSPYRSSLELKKQTASADGEEKIFFEVALVDHFGNPLAGKSLDVVSSRNQDLVQHSLKSNAYGIVRGYVISQDPGISVLSVLVDGKPLFTKPELVFHLPEEGPAIGSDGGLGRFLKAQLFDNTESQSIAYFTIDGLENRVLAGNNETFRVIAKDQDGEVVPNYFGTVRFASTDDQAELPADYLYDEKDQGIHEFSLAGTFNTLGRHSLTVVDLSDFRITGEIEFEVVDSLEQELLVGDPKVELVSPAEGTYRSARVTIAGESGGGVERVRIMDGNILLVEDLEVDEEGGFVYQTAALANGVHEFQAFDMENRAQSRKLVISIDRLPPRVLAIEIDPAKAWYDPGESFNLKVSASEPLSRADCVLLENNYQLEPQGNQFVTTMQAPLECGDYRIGCAVADELGNELNEPNASKIVVCNPNEGIGIEGGTGGEPIEPEPEPEPPLEVPPTAPLNLTGLPDVDKVTLLWSPSTDDEGVENYVVRYGMFPGALDQVNVVPDNRTRWYIDQLSPDTTYYFTVSAIDTQGLESDPSNTIEVRTLQAVKDLPDEQPDSGVSGWMISLVLAFLGMLLIRFGLAREL